MPCGSTGFQNLKKCPSAGQVNTGVDVYAWFYVLASMISRVSRLVKSSSFRREKNEDETGKKSSDYWERLLQVSRHGRVETAYYMRSKKTRGSKHHNRQEGV